MVSWKALQKDLSLVEKTAVLKDKTKAALKVDSRAAARVAARVVSMDCLSDYYMAAMMVAKWVELMVVEMVVLKADY